MKTGQRKRQTDNRRRHPCRCLHTLTVSLDGGRRMGGSVVQDYEPELLLILGQQVLKMDQQIIAAFALMDRDPLSVDGVRRMVDRLA